MKNKTKKILIVNVCKDKLHYFEFVKPIEDILKRKKIKFVTKRYKKIKKQDLKDTIIICGTSLKDDNFLKHMEKFKWIAKTHAKILGICAGMQIIALIFGGKLKEKTEIGYYHEYFNKFLNLKGKQQVYHLHNYYVTLPKEFKAYSKGIIPQAIKHKNKKIYGVLFHPEVRQKNLILEFAKN